MLKTKKSKERYEGRSGVMEGVVLPVAGRAASSPRLLTPDDSHKWSTSTPGRLLEMTLRHVHPAGRHTHLMYTQLVGIHLTYTPLADTHLMHTPLADTPHVHLAYRNIQHQEQVLRQVTSWPTRLIHGPGAGWGTPSMLHCWRSHKNYHRLIHSGRKESLTSSFQPSC